MTENALAASQQDAQDLEDREVVKLAGQALIGKAAGAIQRPRRNHWVRSKTKGSKSPVLVDDVEEPSTLIEVWAPNYEGVHDYLVMFGSPAMGIRVGYWLVRLAVRWEDSTAEERFDALRVAAELLGMRRVDIGFGRRRWVSKVPGAVVPAPKKVEEPTPAQIAYDAYGAATDFLNFRGEPMPSWEELPVHSKAAWVCAADALSPRTAGSVA
ncbi:hypothetical protein [Streptomyces sp. NPDC004528]|uniref:hypothetical protein n=1 Tax=Streptomyces sp. NPDC004528 TaxID=3154550 RepID=UPI0033A52BBA